MARNVWLHRFAVFNAIMTFFVLCAGALVTSTDSGLSVPDWPLSYGMLFPPMVGGILYEHGHRMIAGSVALLTLLQAYAFWRLEPRQWARRLAAAGVLIVLTQAVLGGLTVLFLLPKPISVAHACLAQLFFSLNVCLAVVTSAPWQRPFVELKEAESTVLPLRWFCLGVSVLFFCQLLLGAIMRHTGAGLAIPDFPLVFGGLLPKAFTFAVAVHFAHRIGAYTLLVVVALLAVRIARLHRDRKGLVLWGFGLLALVLLQACLGASVIWWRRPIAITSLHLAIGAVCLACAIALTARVFQLGGNARARFSPGAKSLRGQTELA